MAKATKLVLRNIPTRKSAAQFSCFHIIEKHYKNLNVDFGKGKGKFYKEKDGLIHILDIFNLIINNSTINNLNFHNFIDPLQFLKSKFFFRGEFQFCIL